MNYLKEAWLTENKQMREKDFRAGVYSDEDGKQLRWEVIGIFSERSNTG